MDKVSLVCSTIPHFCNVFLFSSVSGNFPPSVPLPPRFCLSVCLSVSLSLSLSIYIYIYILYISLSPILSLSFCLQLKRISLIMPLDNLLVWRAHFLPPHSHPPHHPSLISLSLSHTHTHSFCIHSGWEIGYNTVEETWLDFRYRIQWGNRCYEGISSKLPYCWSSRVSFDVLEKASDHL